MTKLFSFCFRPRFQFHASPFRKFLEPPKLPRNVFRKVLSATANKQVDKANRRETGRDINKDRQRERGIEKEQPTHMTPHERKANASVELFQQKSRDRHTSMRRQTFKGTHQEDVAEDGRSRQGRKT